MPEMKTTKTDTRWQIRIFSVTWLAYFGFYFGRKNLSVANTALQQTFGFSNSDFAMVVGIFSLSYMIGQYLSGYLSDRYGPRLVVGAGIFLSVAANLLFGLASSLALFLFLAGLNGLGQSTGWSGLIKNMSPWFSVKRRGMIMSWWSTCYVVGGFTGTVFATYWLTNTEYWPTSGYRRAFWAPALFLAVIGFIYIAFTRNRPRPTTNPDNEDVDLLPEEKNESDHWSILNSRSLWLASGMYFFTKLTRYTYLFWLPAYLEQLWNYSTRDAGYISSVYEIGGFAGIIAGGYLSDKVFNSRRFPAAALMLSVLTVIFLVQPKLMNTGMFWGVSAIALIGFFTYGPDSLISAAAAMDIGTSAHAAKAAGIINGVGSAGQFVSPFLTAYLVTSFGWEALSTLFIFTTLFSAILLSLGMQRSQKSLNQALSN